MFKKIILTATILAAIASPAQARGGDGLGVLLGVLGGVAVGEAIEQPQYYPQTYYAQPYYAQQYYYAPTTVYVQPAPVYVPPQQCTNYVQQVYVNGYLTNIYHTACLDQYGRWVMIN